MLENRCYCCFNEALNENGICPVCGYDNAKNREAYPLALPAGSILFGRYIIGKVLGQGGFGITYLAQDYQTKERVAIKEFFPDTMATRIRNTTVTPFSGARGENFDYGKISFLDEAKTMAEFNGNPNIAGVQVYFEENGTAYFVMEYVEGTSFQDYIKSHGGRISWEETMQVILPVLDALSAVHEKGIIHRDVTPDNIYITSNGIVKLLDFGAARYSLGNVSRSLDVILKHGFAPKEQYSRRGRQGPYTDVYSVCATIYYAITGVKPDDAIDRVEEDSMPFPIALGAKISQKQEDALMKGLAVNAENRFQSAAALRAALQSAVQAKKPHTEKRTERPSAQKEERKEDHKPSDQQATAAATAKKDNNNDSGDKRAKKRKSVLPWWQYIVIGIVSTIIATTVSGWSEEKPDTSLPTRNGANTQYVSKLPKTEVKNQMAAAGASGFFNETFWGQTKYKRENVRTISFVDSLDNAPADSWDVSATGDGSVLAWMDGNDLTVAANGRIVLPEDCRYLFHCFTNVVDINFADNVDTSNVTSMLCMFADCESLLTLDLSNFDASNVMDMSCMFKFCRSLATLDLSDFDTANVTNMSSMFYCCNALEILDLSNFDTSNVTDMSQMFEDTFLTKLDLSGFCTSEDTKLDGMFDYSNKLMDLRCGDNRILAEYESYLIN